MFSLKLKKYENIIVTLKLMGCLLFLIGLWSINLFIPIHIYHPIAYHIAYTFRLIFVCYIMVIAYSMFIIKKNIRVLQGNDLIIGFILGGLGGSSDIFLAITTALAYIASMTIIRESEVKIQFTKAFANVFDIVCILALHVFFYVRFYTFGHVAASYGAYRALSPSIVGEVTLRLFLFALAIKITKGNFSKKAHKMLVWIILIIPYVFVHKLVNHVDVWHAITYINVLGFAMATLYSAILTWLFLKRGLLSAIVASFAFNAYNFTYIAYSTGYEIFYWVQPRVIEVVFGF